MKSFILIILIIEFFLNNYLLSQINNGDDSKDLIELNYYEKSNSIKELFQKNGINQQEGIIFLITPNAAPRPEGMIYFAVEELRRRNYNGMVIGLINYRKYYSAMNYIKQRKFHFKCIIDTSGMIFNEIGLGRTPPFITIWDSSGSLINSKCLYGVSIKDSVFWEKFLYNKNSHLKPNINLISDHANIGYNNFDFNYNIPKTLKIIELQDDSLNPIGILKNIQIDPNEKFLIAQDNATLENKLFSLETGEIISILFPKLEIRKYFCLELTNEDFLEEERLLFAKTMLFGSLFWDNKTIKAISVLPEIKIQYQDNDTIFKYYNKYAILDFNIDSLKFTKVIPIDVNIHKTRFAVDCNTSIKTFDKTNNEIALRLRKGYPTYGFKIKDTSDGGNPILESFYEDTPLYYTYNIIDGKKVRAIGKLSNAHKKLGVGYAFVNPQISFNSQGYIIAQTLSPYLNFQTGRKLKLKTYFDEKLMEESNKTPEKLPLPDDIKHLADSAKAAILGIFSDDIFTIIIWKLKENALRLIDSKIFIVQKYNIANSKLIKEWQIPYNLENFELSDYNINPSDNKLITVYQSPLKTKIVFYFLN